MSTTTASSSAVWVGVAGGTVVDLVAVAPLHLGVVFGDGTGSVQVHECDLLIRWHVLARVARGRIPHLVRAGAGRYHEGVVVDSRACMCRRHASVDPSTCPDRLETMTITGNDSPMLLNLTRRYVLDSLSDRLAC